MSHDAHPAQRPEGEAVSRVARTREKQGLRTYVLLVVTMALVIAFVTGISLLLIRHQLREQVTDEFSQDLDHSVIAFQNLQAERLGALERENALLAELPTLKALMTSGDDLTIQDGAAEFWQLSGNDLFMIADPSGRVVAAYAKNAPVDNTLRQGMKALLADSTKHYLIDGGSLYACALRPLYFGSDQDGTLLGYVLSGVSIERTVRQISQPTGIEATFSERRANCGQHACAGCAGKSGKAVWRAFGNVARARYREAAEMPNFSRPPRISPQRPRLHCSWWF